MNKTKLALVALSSVMMSCGVFNCKSNSVSLNSTVWTIEELGGEKVASVDGSYTLTFGEESTLSAKGECNVMNGGYTSDKDGSIKFGQMAVTRMMCPNMEREDKFIKVLNTTTSYSVEKDVLSLFEGDEVVATFNRAK